MKIKKASLYFLTSLLAFMPQFAFAAYDIHASAKAILQTMIIIVVICTIVAAAVEFFKKQPTHAIVIIIIGAVLVFFGFSATSGNGGIMSNVGQAITDFLFGSGQ
ncbi:hypothetical protein PQ692_10185 [Thermoanaerobacterium thermosaccharolyticum]|uniref:hypothetical protein n=1 Tax=Thermoanaerobacterium thermosaccharolyticum TaxID=1517 RepID=UPI003D272347